MQRTDEYGAGEHGTYAGFADDKTLFDDAYYGYPSRSIHADLYYHTGRDAGLRLRDEITATEIRGVLSDYARGVWYKVDLIYIKDVNVKAYFYRESDGHKVILELGEPTQIKPYYVVLGHGEFSVNSSGLFDYVFVRKYIDPEPTHDVWGSEETVTGGYVFEDIVSITVTDTYTIPKVLKIYKVFTFTKVSDTNEIFYIQPNELPNVRIAGGGIKVLSNGEWKNVTPYISKPDTAQLIDAGKCLPYKNGIICNIDDGTNGMLVQMDNRGFILFRCLRGTVTIPLIDGYNYEHNGTLNDSTITLSVGQYALFYKTYKPTVGTYLTTDVENGTGLKVTLTTVDGTVITFYTNYGYGEGKWDVVLSNPDVGDISKTFLKYNDGEFRIPTLPELIIGWDARYSYYHVSLLKPNDSEFLPAYTNDPNTGTNQVLDRVGVKLYVTETGNSFSTAIELECHDTARTHRLTIRFVKEYQHNVIDDIWIVRKYIKLITVTDVKNYDEGGITTGFGLLSDLGAFKEDADHDIQTNYYAFNPSTNIWESLQFSEDGYIWRNGYRGTRVVGTAYGKTIYMYTKYIAKGGTYTLSTYKHARYYWHAWLNHYFAELADITIPAGNEIAFATEIWYSYTDKYEDPVPPETDYGTDTSFIDQYFPKIYTFIDDAIINILV